MSLKLAVIGAGPAGYPAALTAARLGAEVSVIEPSALGGVCLNSGCIPSKSLLDAAHRFDAGKSLAALSQDGPGAPIPDWSKIRARQQAVTAKLTGGIGVLFRQARVEWIKAEASFLDEHTLRLQGQDGEKTLSFDSVIIASGTTAFVPPPLDKIRARVYDNSTIFGIERLPQTLTIVGGGVIGCEFATLMRSLGVHVHMVEMQPRLLPNMDENLSRVVLQNLQKRGVQFFFGKKAADARIENNDAVLALDDGTELRSEAVLAAIGRQCDLTSMHPENAGLSWTRKGLEGVNPHTLQIKEHIYAAGDVTGLSLLAHAASRQGEVAAANICGRPAEYNNDLIPSAVYTTPEIASVGLTRAQAQQRGLEARSRKAFLMANGRALTMDAPEGFIEIVSDKTSGKLLGASVAGPNASEIIGSFCVALTAGMTDEQLKKVVFPHPSVAESITDALNK